MEIEKEKEKEKEKEEEEIVHFDASKATRSFDVCALRVPSSSVGSLLKTLHGYLLVVPKVKSVREDSKETRVIRLAEHIKGVEFLPEDVQEGSKGGSIEVISDSITLTAVHLSHVELMKTFLPGDPESFPSSFETVGHIAHMNLREEFRPFRFAIGEVILLKNPHIKTVVNKVGVVDSQFREFKMELLAGEPSFEATVKEQGCFFTFDFSKVYWNSKLQKEHTSLVESFAEGAVVCDMFAGVGPFAIPAAKKRKCTVFANDLNPNSHHFLKLNAEKNKVQDRVFPSNEDGLKFMKRVVCDEKVIPDHVIMNLPASSVEFLSGLLEVFDGCEKRPLIHVYTFAPTEKGEEGVQRKVEEFLGAPLPTPKIVNVRSVSPKKDMFRVSFQIPLVGTKRSRT